MRVTHLNSGNFEAEVLKSDMPVLVDFFADWCGPCKIVGPILEQLAGQYDGRVKIGKLNIDQAQDIAFRYGVMSIPTLILFRSGQQAGEVVGALPKDQLEEFIDQHITS